jgi:hypothetical protein
MAKDKFDELVEELDLNEVEDFDVKPAKYDVYLYNYDVDQNILDESTLVASYADPDLAIKRAKELIDDTETLERLAAKNAVFVSIEVETTVEREDTVENVGTLFADGVKIK